MLEAIVAIITGLLLLSTLWRSAAGGSGGGAGGMGWLRPAELLVGLLALVLGLLHITDVVGVALFLGGILLLLGALRGAAAGARVPEIVRAAEVLAPFRTLLGLLLLVMGVVLLVRAVGHRDDDGGRGRKRGRWGIGAAVEERYVARDAAVASGGSRRERTGGSPG